MIPKLRLRIRSSLASKLKARKTLKKRKPAFRRQEGFKHARLKDKWRRPKGKHSKLRMREKARGSVPSIGYSSPREVRGLNRLGYREIRVSTIKDLDAINPREEMAVIAGTVGSRKREAIIKAAAEKKIHIANA